MARKDQSDAIFLRTYFKNITDYNLNSNIW